MKSQGFEDLFCSDPSHVENGRTLTGQQASHRRGQMDFFSPLGFRHPHSKNIAATHDFTTSVYFGSHTVGCEKRRFLWGFSLLCITGDMAMDWCSRANGTSMQGSTASQRAAIFICFRLFSFVFNMSCNISAHCVQCVIRTDLQLKEWPASPSPPGCPFAEKD